MCPKFTIKSIPEDFIVEEIAKLPIVKKSTHGAYLLQKRSLNTTDALAEIARKFRVPPSSVAYGGRKDRHASTTQYITIKGPRRPDTIEKKYSLKFQGFMDRPMGPDLIEGNAFTIAVRKLTEGEVGAAKGEIAAAQRFGYPNYFDDQWFGSFDSVQGFLAEKVLLGHFNGALKIHLTMIYSEDPREEKERRSFFSEHWKDWKTCLPKAKTVFEKKALELLSQKPNAFLEALKLIPRDELSLYISAYESFIWNETIRRLLKSRLSEASFLNYPGVAGDYIFYSLLPPEAAEYLTTLIIPTPSPKAKMPDSATASIYADVLKESGIKPAMFNNLKLRQAYFKSIDRRAIIVPEGISAAASHDELNKGKQKLVLKFKLPRGSYATIFLKRIFSETFIEPLH